MPRTVAQAFGPRAADELAKIAIDILCDAPEKQNGSTPSALIRWSLIHEGRAAMERAGIDWRKLSRS